MSDTSNRDVLPGNCQSDAMLIFLRFRDIGAAKISLKRMERRAGMIDGARELIDAVNADEPDDVAIGRAVRRAGQSNPQAGQICTIVSRLVTTHPDAKTDLAPLYCGLSEKARQLHHHEWNFPEQGRSMALRAVWAACVGHGNPGALLPAPPRGICATLTAVPPRDYRGGSGNGGGGGGAQALQQPGRGLLPPMGGFSL